MTAVERTEVFNTRHELSGKAGAEGNSDEMVNAVDKLQVELSFTFCWHPEQAS